MNIIKYPDKCLYLKSEPVSQIDEDLNKLCHEMQSKCDEANGIALAAPQIGLTKRFFVVSSKVKIKDLDQYGYFFINPVITSSKNPILYRESCLSLPGVECLSKRFSSVTLKYQNIFNETKEFEMSGLFSIVCQHEMDHLDGILFIDRLSPIDKRKVQDKINKLRR